MIIRFFIDKIQENFAFNLTKDQHLALEKIADFLFSKDNHRVFILKGYAGTGKSALIGSLVKTMSQMNQKTVLLAPTGRAAKVFSGYADQTALTIHKKIYRQKQFSEEGAVFSLSDNLHKHTLFIVDEASMINNDTDYVSIFGSGRLLDDLVRFVYSGEGCRLLLIGDTAQLPPVKQENSPALSSDILSTYNLDVAECTLTEIVRQAEESGILQNATLLRNALRRGDTMQLPKLKLSGFRDIRGITGTELIEAISDTYHTDGIEETMIIARSNKRVNAYNNGIRNRVLYREEELSTGDLLMITKNNYYWTADYDDLDYLANGELVEVLRIMSHEEMYGFRFCRALLNHKEYDIEFEAMINLDCLHTEAPGLTREQNDTLFSAVMEDYTHLSRKRERYKNVRDNPYYNALQVKYGYAVTCHKAQGGEWQNVFLDIGYVHPSFMGDNFYRWLYTSITRSSKMLFLVNLPKDFIALSE